MTKRIAEDFCAQLSGHVNNSEDLEDVRKVMVNFLANESQKLQDALTLKIPPTIASYVNHSEFESQSATDIEIRWKKKLLCFNDTSPTLTRYANNREVESITFSAVGGTLDVDVAFIKKFANEFRQLAKVVYIFYNQRKMKDYAARTLLILCARKFGQSDFSPIPTDVVKIIATMVWELRFK